MYLRCKGRIDASVGARMTRDDCISTIHNAFAGDGKVTQAVDVVTWSRIVGRSRVLWQAADAWTEMHRVCKSQQRRKLKTEKRKQEQNKTKRIKGSKENNSLKILW